MSDESPDHDDRDDTPEERALDALIVWALRSPLLDDEDLDPMRLPALTDEERAAMNALGSSKDFIARLKARMERGDQ